MFLAWKSAAKAEVSLNVSNSKLKRLVKARQDRLKRIAFAMFRINTKQKLPQYLEDISVQTPLRQAAEDNLKQDLGLANEARLEE